MKHALFFFAFVTSLSCDSQFSKDNLLVRNDVSELPIILEKGPNLMVKWGENSSPLRVSGLNVKSEIIGSIAITTMDLTFHNDSNRVLSGELFFPLNEGQTISRFALEVDGKMRDAVPVEKEKGRVAYESTVRKRVDPGLAEITKGNNFRTRIYPIQPQSHKRVIIAYEQQLTNFKGNQYYRLPLFFKETIAKFNWEVTVLNEEAPKFDNGELSNFSFKKWENQFKASYAESGFRANKEFRIVIPKTKNSKRAIVSKGESGHYFYLNLPVKGKGKPRSLAPESLTIVWDASHSGSKRNSKKELEFLDQYLDQNHLKNIRLLCFSSEVLIDKSFTVKEQLLKEIQNMPFDGATKIDALTWDSFDTDEVLVFSDLIATIGKSNLPIPNKPCYVLNSTSGADYNLQKFISTKSGGEYIDLTKLDIPSAIQEVNNENLQLLDVKLVEGKAKEIFPKQGAQINGDFSISGISNSNFLKMKLNLGYKGVFVQKIIVEVDISDSYQSDGLAQKLWAQLKIEELKLEFSKNEQIISALSKEYGIVTKNTSLIVLDELSDYVLHEITPPMELREEYFKELEKKDNIILSGKKNHEQVVLNNWKKRIVWWERVYKQKKKEKELLNQRVQTRAIERDSLVLDDLEYIQSESYSVSEVEMNLASNSGAFSAFGDLPAEGAFSFSDSKVVEKGNTTEIKIQKWEPDNEEYKLLSSTSPEESYDYYLKLKELNEMNALFYSDAARVFLKNKMKNTAKLVLSNLAELQYDDHEMLKVWANTLMDWEENEEAILVYEEILNIRAEEPQSYRDLGLALTKSGRDQEAIEMLYKVVLKNWDGRFSEIETIVLGEINSIISQSKKSLKTKFINPKFLRNLPVDMRIVIDWDADNMDIDLWVTDPNGEKCLYSHPSTIIGGHLSRDFTGGYGPEEFLLKKTIKGKYKIEVNYFGSRQQRVAGPPTIKARLISNYGKENETEKTISFRLVNTKEVIFIGEMMVD